jgi:CRISPR-associated RAMP protein (TIGR02581 family)
VTALLLDTFQGRLRLEGVLTTRTALHIGAGGSGDPLGTDSPVVRTAAGRPYVPGSSLKGVLRSAAEALLRGGSLQEEPAGEKIWACDPIAGKDRVCVSHDRAKAIREEVAEEARRQEEEPDYRKAAEKIWDESCTVCRLFGSLALAGRVRFADLPLRGEAPLFELRNGVGIDRDKELAADGVLYDFEAVPPETEFELRVTVDNPTDPEVGLLLYLFHELDEGNLTLGGKASRGLGRVRIAWEKIEEITLQAGNPFADLLSSRDLLAPPQTAEPTAAAAAPEAKIPTSGDPETWQTLATILRDLPEIEKGPLGERAAALGLTKGSLNEKLGLGLDERHVRRAWDLILNRLVDSGFLRKEGERYVLAERERPEIVAAGARGGPPDRAPALQNVIDRYVGAMARLWQEAR